MGFLRKTVVIMLAGVKTQTLDFTGDE